MLGFLSSFGIHISQKQESIIWLPIAAWVVAMYYTAKAIHFLELDHSPSSKKQPHTIQELLERERRAYISMLFLSLLLSTGSLCVIVNL